MNLNFNELMNAHTDESSSTIESVPASVSTLPEGENSYLFEPQKGLELCANLIRQSSTLSAKNEQLAAINNSIECDFLSLAEEDDNTQSAKTYIELKRLFSHLDEVAAFPYLEKFYTVAVGGSFSAGKSRFLNSVLGCPSLLPTDTTPTTSIPTYICKGEQDIIEALNFYHQSTPIDEDALQAICHAFGQRFGVTFSHLLRAITVQRIDFNYQNLAFLDTPGYSKADNVINSQQNTDENVAREHLTNTDYLIWLIDQQNGTIPQQDIKFIESLSLNQPILFVISKADKKPEKQIQEIINATKADLERAKINYCDVVGYSASKNREYSPNKNVIAGFLQQVNQGKSGSIVLWQLKQIFSRYQSFFESAEQNGKLTSRTVKELVFDESVSLDKQQHLQDLLKKSKAQLQDLAKQKKSAQALYQQLHDQIERFCQLLGVATTMSPSASLIKSARQKHHDKSSHDTENGCHSYSFEALLKGDINQLAKVGDLTDLTGHVAKVSAIGVSIDLAMDFEIIIPKQRISDITGVKSLTKLFTIDQSVTVQIVNDKKAIVSVELTKQ